MTLSEFRFVLKVAASRFGVECEEECGGRAEKRFLDLEEKDWWEKFQTWISERWMGVREGEGDV